MKSIVRMQSDLGSNSVMRKLGAPGIPHGDFPDHYGKEAKAHFNSLSDKEQSKVRVQLREPTDAEGPTAYKNAVRRAGVEMKESVSDHPMKDPIKGSAYEKMKRRPGDDEKIERHFRTTQKQKRRIDTDESVEPRSLAKKILEIYRHGRQR